MTVVNPNCAILVKGTEDWWSEEEDIRLDMDIDIVKTLEPTPNEATVTIYNLNDTTRSRILDPSQRDIPIEIYFTPFGSGDLVPCYRGEIERVDNNYTRPGWETILHCKSQSFHTRGKYITQKTYSAGTAIEDIINDFLDAIDLPSNIEGVPSNSILLGATFSGPAFLLLRKFLWNYGMFAHIQDGIVHISGVYSPPNPTVIEISESFMLTSPTPTEYKDARDVQLHTVTDNASVDPFAKKKKRKKTKRTKKIISKSTRSITDQDRLDEIRAKKTNKGTGDYVDYEAVDTTIYGVRLPTLGLPVVNPDNLINIEGEANQFRVQRVRHYGSNDGTGFTTEIDADIYEDAYTSIVGEAGTADV